MRAALFCIFTYLDTKTLLRAAEVCRDWKFVARHPAVWTRVLLENARISSKVRDEPDVFARPGIVSAKRRFSSDLCLFSPPVPEHPVPVVHSDTLPHPAEPQAQTAGKEGKQGGLFEKHTVSETSEREEIISGVLGILFIS